MCGIVGVIGDIGLDEEYAFKDMLQFDVVRGKDSTGIICVGQDGTVATAKEAWLPQDFLQTRDVLNIFSNTHIGGLIGHNRQATVGNVSKATAHPFDFANIAGVHNGTTDKWRFDRGNSFEVDSEALYAHANDKGIEDAWGCVSRAASLAMFDKLDGQFKLIRNSERPMFYTFSEDRATMFFASEPWMISAACSRGKRDIKLDEKFGIKATELNKLYSIPLGTDFKEGLAPVAVKPFQHPARTDFKNINRRTGKKNTTATSHDNLQAGEKVDFKVVGKATYSGGTLFRIESTSTKNKLSGRCFVGCLDTSLIEDLEEDGAVFEGVIAGVHNGTNPSFSVSAQTVVELFFDEDEELEDAIFVGSDANTLITRSMFNRAESIKNDCAGCGNPLSFDSLDFVVIEDHLKKRGCLCKDCADSPSISDYVTQGLNLLDVHPVISC